MAEPDGKKRRILLGEKFVRGTGPFSYTVRGLRWSPDGSKLTIEMGTSEMINDDGDMREGVMTLLLDDAGREIIIPGADSVIPGAMNAAWQADGVSVIYLTELAQATAKAPGAAWNMKQDGGVAIERDSGATGTPRLVSLDIARETLRVLGALEGYAGGLSVSPSGKRVAYWIDNEQLEVREIGAPNRMARARIAFGTLAWSADETRVLVKRGPALRSGGLAWFALPPLIPMVADAAPDRAEVAPRSIYFA